MNHVVTQNALLAGYVQIDATPKIILICGPARTGTTALSHVFIRAGVKSHMQPIKSILRALDGGEPSPQWHIKESSNSILSKETLGIRLACEYFNPVKILVDLGYPPQQIMPILIVRDPLQTFASWQGLWGSASLEQFVLSFQKIAEIREYCQQAGMRYLSFVHESIKRNSSDGIIEKLLQQCGISARLQEVMDWHNAPKFGDDDPKNAHVFFYDSPPEKFIAGVRNWGGYTYQERVIPPELGTYAPELAEPYRIYWSFLESCERDFAIVV